MKARNHRSAGARDYVETLNRAFAAIGTWSFDHRMVVMFGCIVLLGVSTVLASRARVDNSFEAYFDTTDPTYATYLRYRDDFGSEEISYILYSAPGLEGGPFNLEVMRKIALLTKAIETEVPFVREVTSLTNVEYVEGSDDGLDIHELLEEVPPSQSEMLEIRRRALAEPLYVDGLVSSDGNYAAAILEMELSSVDPIEKLRLDADGGDELDNLYPQVSYHAIEDILARPEFAGIEFSHVGDVSLNATYNEIIEREGPRLAVAAFAVIGLLLFGFFLSPIGVFGPLAVVVLAVVIAAASVVLLGWRIDMMFQMVPNLVIAVGVADGVHIVAEFRARFAALGDRREALRESLFLVGTPCLLTSLTTAAGFMSMAVSPIKAISHFAVCGAIGVMAAFALSLTLLFVFLSFGPRSVARELGEREKLRARGGRWFLAALAWVARFDIRHRRAILAASAVVFAISAVGISHLRVDSNFLHEFRERQPIRVATDKVDEVMGGVFSLIYLFDSGEPDGVKDPALLRDIEGVRHVADSHTDLVGKTYAIGDLLKDINQAFHAEDPEYYALPTTRDMIGQYLLVYEMSGGRELDDYLSGDFSRASLELRVRSVEASALRGLADDIDSHLESHPVGGAGVTLTGVGALWLKMQEYITQSQIWGFTLAFVVVAALLCLIFRSFKIGMIAMVPNLAPVVLTLGGMGWLGIPLDYVRLLIASIAIGISVDDTIHHVTRFRLEFARCGNYAQALEITFCDVGRALVITSVVLVCGFLVFTGSTLASMGLFGVLISTTVAVAFVADFLLMPALVLTLQPFGPEK